MPEPAEAKLFDRPASNGHNGNGHNGNGYNGANGHGADVEADIARVFGNGAAERPANRILPDLTAKPPVQPVEDEAQPQRRPRVAKSKAPRIPKPKPLPVSLREPVEREPVEPAPAPTLAPRIHRRPRDESGLARAERWKRRLPRFAR